MSKKLTSSIKHSFVFPVHNEAPYLAKQLKLFYQLLKKERITRFEVLLVENGSTDQSWKIIKQLTNTHHNLKGLRFSRPSYGQALKHGILSALGQFIYILNVDFFDSGFVHTTKKLLKNYEVVVGSKTLASSHDRRSLLRRSQTRFFHYLLKVFFAYPGTDTHGLKAFRRTSTLINTLRSCASKHELLDTELLLKIHRLGKKIKEIPINVAELRPTRYTPQKRITAVLVDFYRLASFYLVNILNRRHKRQKNKLVIADDYGLFPIVNQAILDQVEAKNLDGVSVLANLVSKADAKKLVYFKKQIKIGFHFNLTRGKPVTKPELILSLVDYQGNFFPLFIFLIKLLSGQIRLNEIDLELNNQFKRLESLALLPTYVDSEQHIHIFNLLAQPIVRTANRHNLPIRSTASSVSYLKFRPHKYLMFCVLQALFFFRFFSLKSRKDININSVMEAIITHPGSSYD
jgi:predicted glycoside hydrolase/deacetylase ChbG (UPF0249 family)